MADPTTTATEAQPGESSYGPHVQPDAAKSPEEAGWQIAGSAAQTAAKMAEPSSAQAALSAAKTPDTSQAQPKMATVPYTPEKTVPVAMRPVHKGLRGVIDKMADAITGETKPELWTDGAGNQFVYHPYLSEGQQWTRIGGSMLAGAAAGLAAGRGGNMGGAAAAGVAAGMGLQGQQKQNEKEMTEEARKTNETNANYQMLRMKMAENAWTMARQQHTASQEDVKFSNEQIDRLTKAGGVIISTPTHPGELGTHPDLAADLVHNHRIETVPTVDMDGHKGLTVIRMPGNDEYRDKMVPAGEPIYRFDSTKPPNEQMVPYKTSDEHTRGEIDDIIAAEKNKQMEWNIKQADLESKQQATKASISEQGIKEQEAPLNRAKTKAEIAKDYAEAATAQIEYRNLANGLTKDGLPTGTSAALDPSNPANHDSIVKGLQDGSLKDTEVFGGRMSKYRPGFIADVKHLDPSWTEARFDAAHKAWMDYNNQEGMNPGAQITSFNYMAGHSDDFLRQMDLLRANKDRAPLLSKGMNWMRKNIKGEPDIAAILVPMDNLRTEFQRFVLGANLTETDKKAMMAKLDTDMTPLQMEGVAKEMLATGVVRMGGLNNGFKRPVGYDFPGLLDPTTQEVLKKEANGKDPYSKNLAYAIDKYLPAGAFKGAAPAQAQPAPAAQSAPEPIPVPGQPMKLNPGEVPAFNAQTKQQIISRNGRWFDIKNGQEVK